MLYEVTCLCIKMSQWSDLRLQIQTDQENIVFKTWIKTDLANLPPIVNQLFCWT